MFATAPFQVTETNWEVDEDWEVMIQRGTKKRTEGNINLKKRDY
jgi:hypothetical protein